MVAASRDVAFFEDGLPPPTIHDLATQADDADYPNLSAVPTNHLPFLRLRRQPHLVIKLPGQYMTPRIVFGTRVLPMGIVTLCSTGR